MTSVLFHRCRASGCVAVLLGLAGCREIDQDGTVAMATRPARVEVETEPKAPIVQQPVIGATVVVPDFSSITQQIAPAVVSVISTLRGKGHRPTVRGLGSGMLVSANGQVLTNEHVVADASSVDVELATHERIPAHVIYADSLLDLALIQLDRHREGLQPVRLGTRAPVPGEWVMAVGQPFGLGHTVTVGVVSGLGRDHDDLGRPSGLRPDGIWSFIQTDAPINVGNSGGPLVDTSGEVLGITTAARTDGQGLAFAIPAAMARRFLDEVWTYGRMRHARLGIRGETAGPEAFAGRASVVRITQVDSAGPGTKAGLREGDVILAIDEQPVTRVGEVAYLTQLAGVGARMTLTVKRGNEAAQQLLVIPAETK